MRPRVRVLDAERSIVEVAGVLDPSACAGWLAAAEARGFEAAPITTARGFVHRPDVRNNTRAMWDDPAGAAALWALVRPFAPQALGPWRAVGLNERLRVYRYVEGQYFAWHFDGCFERDDGERSLLTCMLYLDGGLDDLPDDAAPLRGGETEFDGLGAVVPATGKLLLFAHDVRHRGAPVLAGTKHVLRTDVMYRHGGA